VWSAYHAEAVEYVLGSAIEFSESGLGGHGDISALRNIAAEW
jgi:hypothetical protein